MTALWRFVLCTTLIGCGVPPVSAAAPRAVDIDRGPPAPEEVCAAYEARGLVVACRRENAVEGVLGADTYSFALPSAPEKRVAAVIVFATEEGCAEMLASLPATKPRAVPYWLGRCEERHLVMPLDLDWPTRLDLARSLGIETADPPSCPEGRMWKHESCLTQLDIERYADCEQVIGAINRMVDALNAVSMGATEVAEGAAQYQRFARTLAEQSDHIAMLELEHDALRSLVDDYVAMSGDARQAGEDMAGLLTELAELQNEAEEQPTENLVRRAEAFVERIDAAKAALDLAVAQEDPVVDAINRFCGHE
jgi:hypothetical protein